MLASSSFLRYNAYSGTVAFPLYRGANHVSPADTQTSRRRVVVGISSVQSVVARLKETLEVGSLWKQRLRSAQLSQ